MILLTQALLIVIGFFPFFKSGGDYLFQFRYDGFKNYYTYYAYVNQSAEAGFARLESQFYPYGDYIFFTDNTPIFAFLTKLFSNYIYDLQGLEIPIYNLFFLSGILLTSWFLYKLTSDLLHSTVLIFLVSLGYAWLHPQILRLLIGHFNLSFAWIFVASIYLLWKTWRYFDENDRIRAKEWILLGLLMILAVFIHLYYLLLIGFMAGTFVLVWSVYLFISKNVNWKKNLRPLYWGGGASAVALVTVLGIIKLIDKYAAEREAGTQGFDYIDWKLRIQGIFTPYDFNGIPYLLEYKKHLNYESHAYMGAFFLFGILLWAIGRKLAPATTLSYQKIFSDTKGRFLNLPNNNRCSVLHLFSWQEVQY